MAINNNFLPKFDISKNLSNDLRNIEIAKQLTAGWYKGNFDKHLRKAGYVSTINGKEYYTNVAGLLYLQADFFTEGTNGWHIAEWLKLIGLQEDDLKEIQSTAGQSGVDGIYHSWKAKAGISSAQFKHNLQRMKELLSGVDEVRVDYENQRYKTSIYNTGALRPYNTKESLYGDSLQWASEQQTYDALKWTSDYRILSLENIMTKPSSLAFGKSIRFYSGGIDVTANYNNTIKNAVQSMIMYSGNEFMQRVSSNKISEVSYDVSTTIYGMTETANYTAVTGTEVFNATIKQAFMDDVDDRHFIRYTALVTSSGTRSSNVIYSKSPETLDGRDALTNIPATIYLPMKVVYTNTFWTLVGYIRTLSGTLETLQPMINEGDEFLFYNSGDRNIGLYIDVEEFRKLSLDEIGYLIGEYFDIRVTVDDGGFFDSFIGFVAGFLGLVFNGVYNLLNVCPITRIALQVFTKAVNEIFSSDLSEKEMFDIIAQVAVFVGSILLAPPTGGTSLGLSTSMFAVASVGVSLSVSLGIAGSNAEIAKKEAEEKASQEKQRKKDLADIKKIEDEQKKKRRKV